MAETLVVVSKVKKIVKDAGLRTSGEYVQALSDKISQMVTASIEKVKADGSRKTLGTQDLQ